eukprot:COSAG01_NODE_7786_length_3057_cov_8.888438_2_plen_146_part_00
MDGGVSGLVAAGGGGPPVGVDPAQMRARAAQAGCRPGTLSEGMGAAAVTTAATAASQPPLQLFVGNLAYTVSEAQLRLSLGTFGTISQCKVVVRAACLLCSGERPTPRPLVIPDGHWLRRLSDVASDCRGGGPAHAVTADGPRRY